MTSEELQRLKNEKLRAQKECLDDENCPFHTPACVKAREEYSRALAEYTNCRDLEYMQQAENN